MGALGHLAEELLALWTGPEIGLRCGASADWQGVLARLPYVPCPYTGHLLDFMAQVLADGQECLELSVVLRQNRQAIGVWPFFLTRRAGGRWRLSSGARPVLAPLFVPEVTVKSRRRLVGSVAGFVDRVAARLPSEPWTAEECFAGETGVGEWQRQLARSGYRVYVTHDLFVDLSLGFPDIRARFRDSYQSLVNSGLRLWAMEVLKTGEVAVWEEYRSLYRTVTGRETQPGSAWDCQLRAIAEGAAFLVCLRDKEGAMVGGGYFAVSGQEGLYSMAAYDRRLFAHPLGHVVQVAAIREMQERGLRWYLVGQRLYGSERPPQPVPTPKELSIARFKEGFATHVMPRFYLAPGGESSGGIDSGPDAGPRAETGTAVAVE